MRGEQRRMAQEGGGRIPLTRNGGRERNVVEYLSRVRKPTLYPLSYGGRTV